MYFIVTFGFCGYEMHTVSMATGESSNIFTAVDCQRVHVLATIDPVKVDR
jgi:hypothetical protein